MAIEFFADIDVTGELEGDSLDVNGNSQLDGTLTVGVDDTGYDVKLYGATTSRFLHWDESEDYLLFRDNVKGVFGNSADLKLYHDSNNSYIENNGGNLYIMQRTDDGDMSFQCDAGDGTDAEYFRLDGGTEKIQASKRVKIDYDNADATSGQYAFEIDFDVTGSQSLSSDVTNFGGYIHAQTTATGGDTSDEHRLTGFYTIAKADGAGDPDLVKGIEGNAQINATSNTTITNTKGGYFTSYQAGNNGTVSTSKGLEALAYLDSDGPTATTIYGVHGRAYHGSNATTDSSNIYGGYFFTDMDGSGTIAASYGAYSEVEIGAGTITNAYGNRSGIDHNGGTITNSYQYYGTTSGTISSNNWGIYSTGADKNYLSSPLFIGTTSSSGDCMLRVLKSDTDPSTNTTAMHLDYNVSGSGATGGDINHIALRIDTDSSATGGDTSDEHRLYGLYLTTDMTGDSDLNYGIYNLTTTNHSGGTVSNTKGFHNNVKLTSTGGATTNAYGIHNYITLDDAGVGNISYLYGDYNQVNLTNYDDTIDYIYTNNNKIDLGSGSATVTNARGVNSEIEVDAGTVTNGMAFNAILDQNGGTFTTGYILKGDIQGTIGTAWGIKIDADAYNKLSGYLSLGKDHDATSSIKNVLTVYHGAADNNNGVLIVRDDTSTAANDLLGAIGFDSTDGNVPSSALEASAYIAAYASEDHATTDKGGYLVIGTSTIDQNDDTTSVERIKIEDTVSTFSQGITVGVDDTGYDVIFYGATSGKKMQWDESADTLIVDGALDINGNADISGATTTSGDITATASNATISAAESGGATTKIMGASVGRVGTSSNHNLEVLSNNTAAITIDTSQNATFAGNVTLSSNSNVVSARKFTARDGNGVMLTADDATSGLSIADNGNATFTGTLTIPSEIIHSGDTDNKIGFTTDTQTFTTGNATRMDITNSGIQMGGSGARVTTILDEDDLSTDSATALATQQSIKAYVDANAGGGGVSISNNANNRVLTGDGSNANGEANLTFDGSALTLAGSLAATGDSFTFSSSTENAPIVEIKTTHTTVNAEAELRFTKDASNTEDQESLGMITFYGDDDAGNQLKFAHIRAKINDASNNAEGGRLFLAIASNDGEMQNGLELVDGDAEDEIDVKIGSGSNSITTIKGDLKIEGLNILDDDDVSCISFDSSGNTTISNNCTFSSTSSEQPMVLIQNRTNDSTAGTLKFENIRGQDAQDNDILGQLEFWGYDDGTPSTQQYAGIVASIQDASSGAEEGQLDLKVAAHDGELVTGLSIFSGDQEDEVDIQLGNGANSRVTIPGNLVVGSTTLPSSALAGTADTLTSARTIGGVSFDGSANIDLPGVNEAGTQPITFSKSSTADGNHTQGDVVYFGSTTSMTAGAIYHFKSDGTWELADADAASTCDGMLGVALGAASDTNGVLLRGMVTLDHDPGAVGDVLFLSTTAGDCSATAPSGNGDIIRVVGYCLDASNGQIYFNPDGTYVEVSA